MKHIVGWFKNGLFSTLLVTLSLVLCACGPDDPQGKQDPSPAQKPHTSSEKKSGPKLQEVTLQGLQDRIEAHRGQVVLLDVWATWCLPCVKSWPKLVSLAEKYEEKGLAILTLSTDAPDKTKEVRSFLREHGAPGESLHLDAQNYDDFVTQMGEKWEGGLPAVLLYDRSGTLRYELLGARASAGVKDRVEELLHDE